jgi:hypothetical protein
LYEKKTGQLQENETPPWKALALFSLAQFVIILEQSIKGVALSTMRIRFQSILALFGLWI